MRTVRLIGMLSLAFLVLAMDPAGAELVPPVGLSLSEPYR
jgi:hypothetical protein